METRQERILKKLLEFYSCDINIKQITDIVVFKTKKIPLRMFEWFVTNYSKKFNIRYDIKRPNGTIETFKVYQEYISQVKSKKKENFDPYCRGPTIILQYKSPHDEKIISFQTGIRQLNFFKWAIENLIIDYIESHYDEIYKDLTENVTSNKLTNLSQMSSFYCGGTSIINLKNMASHVL
jgi:hypothetical protein